jgi:hypothetical protein
MEVWKDIPDYEGIYQVSNLGRVKSLMFNKEKILKQVKSSNGYFMVGLWKEKKTSSHLVHRIVYHAFCGIKSCRQYVIDHIDNNKENNNLSNLQYITNRQNSSKDKNSKTGESNIYLNSNAYLVRMTINNIKKSIGTYKTIEEAVIARDNFIRKFL